MFAALRHGLAGYTRRRGIGIYMALALLNILLWAAVADHIAAIGNATRELMQQGTTTRRSRVVLLARPFHHCTSAIPCAAFSRPFASPPHRFRHAAQTTKPSFTYFESNYRCF